jgi:hypothetical protein
VRPRLIIRLLAEVELAHAAEAHQLTATPPPELSDLAAAGVKEVADVQFLVNVGAPHLVQATKELLSPPRRRSAQCDTGWRMQFCWQFS